MTRPSDIEILSDVQELYTPLERTPPGFRAMVKNSRAKASNANSRKAFFDERDRKPSLPRITFLEGKGE